MPDRRKIVVGLSGGVDSSIALLLLKQQGFVPFGVFLKFAYWERGIKNSKKVCEKLDIPFYIVDCQKEFRNRVIKYFLETLKNKQTPNPCVFCNKNFKFKKLFEFAKRKGIKLIATGHYARIREDKTGKYELLKAKDKTKDQSYFLCLLNQDYLKNIIFPLGDYTKKQVYQIAKKNKLNFLSEQKQSQDLCFDSQKIIKQEIKEKPGKIVDTQGNILGEHKGLHFYTIGQRKGINLSSGPWRVVNFDKNRNCLIITNNDKDPALYNKTIFIKNYNFISGKIIKKKIKIKIKLRYRNFSVSAVLYPPKNNNLKLVFNKLQKSIAPGQWAVFYDKEVCLGGGEISL
ncbi:tRNA 2-thiouridine(34) synthase MnmA [Patescibacteria group bacterium]